MSSWAGFTDEELSRLRQTAREDVGYEGSAPGSRKKASINTVKRHRPREKVRSRATSSEKIESGKQEGDEDQGRGKSAQSTQQNTGSRSTANNGGRSTSRLHSREEEKENSSPECERRGKNNCQVKEGNALPEEAPPKTRLLKKVDDPHGKDLELGDGFQMQGGSRTDKELESDLPEIIDESDRIQAIELSALEKMQEKQKQIEQENKRKKAALQEAIKKRYQKTQAEAHTLSLVQKELSHLDSLLSADVAILRDKIEESSREYLSAQKRYEKAEKEFVEAKVDLHRKTERKDLLTEHLYTIIRENELRKAKKLEELMAKLNVANQEGFSLHTDSDAPGMKQNHSKVSVPLEEKASGEILELNSGSNICDNGEEKTVIKQTQVDVKPEKFVSEAVPEKEITVTS